MSKRATDRFGRRQMDFYPTPAMAIDPVIPHLWRTNVKTFAEPCFGDGDLAEYLEACPLDFGDGEKHRLHCIIKGDLKHDPARDARMWSQDDFRGVDATVTNPPWEAKTMMEIMERQSLYVPSWFLIYSDWLFTKQSARLMWERCTDIVPIGRVKWFPESTSVGYDNCCWIRLDAKKNSAVEFWPLPVK